MILWHIGGTVAIFRYVFRDPRVDLRFLAGGALLPGHLDAVLMWSGVVESWRSLGHTLVLPSAVMLVVLVVTRPGAGRKRGLALAVGMLTHLVLDAMWLHEDILLWPFLETSFDVSVEGGWLGGLPRPDIWDFGRDAVGLGYLLLLGQHLGWGDRSIRSALLRTGQAEPV